jgi:hypothetical protein
MTKISSDKGVTEYFKSKVSERNRTEKDVIDLESTNQTDSKALEKIYNDLHYNLTRFQASMTEFANKVDGIAQAIEEQDKQIERAWDND